MISRIKMNPVSFKSNAPVASENNQTQVEKPKTTLTDRYNQVKKGATDVFKKVNTVLGVSTGAAQGVAEGAVVAGALAIVGKNAQEGGITWGTVKGIAKDAWSVAKVVPNTVKNLWTKSPKDNIVSAFKSVPEHAKNIMAGMKKHKQTTAVALVAGLAIFMIRTFQGKIQANNTNAGIDHRTNQGHTH